MNLIEKLVTLGRHLPPSHTIPPGLVNEVVAGLAYLSEHGDEFLSIAEKDAHEIGDAVHEFFNAHAEKVNEQYRQDHPDAGTPAGQPSYQELLRRIAALESARQPTSGAASGGQVAPGSTPVSSPAPPAAPTTPAEAPATVAEIPAAPASASPAEPASPAAVQAAPTPVAEQAQAQASGEQPTYEELLQAYQSAQIQRGHAEAQANPPTAVDTPPAEGVQG